MKLGRIRAFLPALAMLFAAVARGQELPPPGFEEAPPSIGSITWSDLQHQGQQDQDRYLLRIPIPDAVKDDLGTAHPQTTNAALQEVPLITARGLWQAFIATLALVFTGVLLFPRVAPRLEKIIARYSHPWDRKPADPPPLFANFLAEDEGIAEFIAALKGGPVVAPGELLLASPSPGMAALRSQPDPLAEFFASVTPDLNELRSMLREVGREADTLARQKMLAHLAGCLHAFKGKAALPEVLPVWHMASALEGLLKQLTDRANTVTRSTLRTLANGVDVLAELCRPGLDPRLATDPPFRLLTVDDDPVCLNVVSRALGKALNKPDLAKHAGEALVLAARQTYDVIFLDVQMPGMDGFELCSKIHQTPLNAGVPVVFVTCLSDFDSRAKSILAGGDDLIAKPFLTFEITVKALTLALRGRLDAKARAANPNAIENSSVPPETAPVSTAGKTARNATSPAATHSEAQTAPSSEGELPPTVSKSSLRPAHAAASTRTLDRVANPAFEEVALAFFKAAPARLQALHDSVDRLCETDALPARQEILAELYLHLHALAPPHQVPQLQAAFKIFVGLEGLLKKLLKDPAAATSSVQETITAAVDLLDRLCVKGLHDRLATEPPVRLLVVDDDSISRRMLLGALQVAFEKPDSAEDGETALALTAGNRFDVIFLDVVMPGMDGFAVCPKIRETAANRDTPVIFVTGCADPESRAASARCGGDELISKPFLGPELTLKALTFALRGRLDKLEPDASVPGQNVNGGNFSLGRGCDRAAADRAREDRRTARQKRRIDRRKARALTWGGPG